MMPGNPLVNITSSFLKAVLAFYTYTQLNGKLINCTTALPLIYPVCNDLLLPDCAVTVYDYDSGGVTFECKSGCIPSGRNSPLVCNPETWQFEGENTLMCSPGR